MLTTDSGTHGDTYLAHFPAGTVFQPHWHSNGEYAVLLQSKVTHVIGGSERTELKPGDYVVVPAKTNHAWEIASSSAVTDLTCREGSGRPGPRATAYQPPTLSRKPLVRSRSRSQSPWPCGVTQELVFQPPTTRYQFNALPVTQLDHSREFNLCAR